ncbi:MAG: hypothetical protein HVN35_05545 [Methanobacteriaceae archaeon]|nr:hypothetical protein [Methanobacteriaceae archaeon]
MRRKVVLEIIDEKDFHWEYEGFKDDEEALKFILSTGKHLYEYLKEEGKIK